MESIPRTEQYYHHVEIGGSSRAHLGNVYNQYGPSPDERILNEILDSLSYPGMNDRRDALPEAHEGTFDWTFLEGETKFVTRRYVSLSKEEEELSESERVQMSFKTWLQDEKQGLFFFSGKPGSGKSTFMKRLASNDEVVSALKDWTGEHTLLRADHYFWVTGKPMQKSLEGMLRSLLYSVLRGLVNIRVPEKLELVKHICGDRWLSADTHSPWSCSELKLMLTRLSTLSDLRIFFLIDALDECEPQDQLYELATEVLRISRLANIKICASCRPWKVFTNSFAHCQTLRLDQLTYCDMETYVHSRLLVAEAEGDLQTDIRDGCLSAKEFICRVVDAAEGVFLWTKLVTNELCSEMRKGRSIQTLGRLLTRIPTDLDDYFHKLIFDRIGKSQQNVMDTAAALRLAMTILDAEKKRPTFLPFSRSYINFWLLSNGYLKAGFSWKDYERIVQPSVERMIKQTANFLEEACSGLLVLCPQRKTVDFFHRTVVDYLSDNHLLAQSALEHFGNDDFIDELARLRCICVLRNGHERCYELMSTLDSMTEIGPVCTAPWALVCESLVTSQLRMICFCQGLHHMTYTRGFACQLMVAGFNGFVCAELEQLPLLAACEPIYGVGIFEPDMLGSALQAIRLVDDLDPHSVPLQRILECGSNPNGLRNHSSRNRVLRTHIVGSGAADTHNEIPLQCQQSRWESWLGDSYIALKKRKTWYDGPQDLAVVACKQRIFETIELLLYYGANPCCLVCIQNHDVLEGQVICKKIGLEEILNLLVPSISLRRLERLRSMFASKTLIDTLHRNRRSRAVRSLIISEQNICADFEGTYNLAAKSTEELHTLFIESMMNLFSLNPSCYICQQRLHDQDSYVRSLIIWCVECESLSCLCTDCSEHQPAIVPKLETPCETNDGTGSTQRQSHKSAIVVCGAQQYLPMMPQATENYVNSLKARYPIIQAISLVKEWYTMNPINLCFPIEEVLADTHDERSINRRSGRRLLASLLSHFKRIRSKNDE